MALARPCVYLHPTTVRPPPGSGIPNTNIDTLITLEASYIVVSGSQSRRASGSLATPANLPGVGHAGIPSLPAAMPQAAGLVFQHR